MNEMERYLKRATRGLWGQKRLDAQAELRGAIEDKLYRCRLLGLNEAQAVASALRELGSPAAIARELGEVHTVPQTLKVLAFVGVAGLLGWQAAAQVAVVKSAYGGVDAASCRLQTITELAALTMAQRSQYERLIADQGGPNQFLVKCRNGDYGGLALLKVSDLLDALRAGGIKLAGPAEVTPTTPLIAYSGPNGDVPGDTFETQVVQGVRYVYSGTIVPFLTRVTALPIGLSGLTNPTLQVGEAKLQLGTAQAPVRATDLVAAALEDQRAGNAVFQLPVEMYQVPEAGLFDPQAPKLAVPGKDGDLFAVVQNFSRISGGEQEALWVRARQDGTIQFTNEVGVNPRTVTSLDALDAATTQGQAAILVYRLDISDLQNVKLTPVPAVQLKIQSP